MDKEAERIAKPEDGKACCEMLSFAHDTGNILINPLKMLLSIHDLHKMKPPKNWSKMGEGLSRPHPSLRRYWQLTAVGRGRIILYEGVAIGGCSMF